MGLPTNFARASLSDLTLHCLARPFGRNLNQQCFDQTERGRIHAEHIDPAAGDANKIDPIAQNGGERIGQLQLSGPKLTVPRRVVAKVEWHPGELYPRVDFIVTNLSRPVERVVAFYNKRGTCEQWIKEGKNAIKVTRLSCCSFAANAVRFNCTRWPTISPTSCGRWRCPRRSRNGR